MYKLITSLLLLLITHRSITQTLGGNTVFSFLHMPTSTQQTALGGVNISHFTNDVGVVMGNPALLKPSMHQQLHASFNNFFANIKNYGVTTAYHLNKSNTTLGFGLQYLNYGSITQTDAVGNIFNQFTPTDYCLQLMAQKNVYQRFSTGIAIKYIHSNYGIYKSSGLAFDVGINYIDTSIGLQIGFLVKNMGTQINTYNSSNTKEELPFNIQMGISKKLEKAPLQFGITTHSLQRLNRLYNDTSFNNTEGIENAKISIINAIAQHVIISAQVFLGKKIECTFGYNFTTRNNLNVINSVNGLNGASLGLGLLLNKCHIRYTTGFYQRNQMHQIGLNIHWKGHALHN